MKNVAKYVQRHLIYLPNNIRDRLQISLLILSKVKWTYQLLIRLKSLEKLRFPDGFRGDESSLIRINSLNIRCKIWRRSVIHRYFLTLQYWPTTYISVGVASLPFSLVCARCLVNIWLMFHSEMSRQYRHL